MSEKSKVLLDLIQTRRLYFDGGMGTLLQEKGMQAGETSEEFGIRHPEIVTDVHRAYVDTGCNIITTNTFGVNIDKYNDPEKYVAQAITCAKGAVANRPDCFVAFDIGPTGKLMEPMGPLTFERAVEIFAHSVKLAEKHGADLIIIETMTDMQETKAAVTAAKSCSDLPVFVTNVYGENGRLMTGAAPKDMVKMLSELGVDAIGINCSLGPNKMIPIVEELVKYSSLPIIVNPNAGLPEIQNGKTVYNISPKEFAGYMIEIVNSGACLIGGCCGTTPEYLKEVILATKDLPYLYPEKKSDSIFNEPADSGTPDEGNENSVAADSELMTAIFEGEDDDAVRTAEELVKTISPIDIINTHIIPALNRVGDAFASGDIFLPELMMSAETASAAFNTVKKYMSQSSDNSDKNKKSIIIATVKGDVHDIGKDIVKVLLESYGFEVYDLGIDVAPEKIADCAFDTGCKLVGLSALMTTTVPAMAQTIQLLHERDDSVKVIVGGAVLTKELADEIGADFYSPDAMATVHHAEKFYA